MTATDNATLVQLDYKERGSHLFYTLKLDRATQFNVHARRDDLVKRSGDDLRKALQQCGAVYHDALDAQGRCIPAEQHFDAQTGQRTYLAHYTNGALQDPATGAPAKQDFDAQTGKRTRLAHYTNGKRQDPPSGEPAEQHFHLQTGKRNYLAHWTNSRLQDPASGDPALQTFDAQTGQRTYLAHWTNGAPQDPASGDPALQTFDAQTGLVAAAYSTRKAARLSQAELRTLNEKHGMTPPLPSFLTPAGPALRPA